jgi:hypothetical protein
MSIDLESLDDENESKVDFRRANGAPLVSDPHDPTKTLRYSRPSSYAKCLDDEEALVTWKIWKAMDGVARSPALQHEVVVVKDEDRTEKKALREKAMDRGNATESADKGHALHAMTVRAEDLSDVAWDPPEWVQPDLDAYLAMLDRYGLVSEMVEVPFVNDEYRAAGTADRVWRTTKPLLSPTGPIEIGELLIGDLKTGKKLDFSLPGFCVQTALYATGVLYDVVTEKRLATPPINNAWTLLAHMPVGTATCRLHWCPVPIGIDGAELAKDVKEWRKLWKNGTYDAPVVDGPEAIAPPEPDDLRGLLSEHLGAEVVSEVSIERMAAFCQGRINAIGARPEAKAKLIQRWPDGLPTPKKGLTSPDQVVTLMNLLDAIEAEFSIPFGETDPRYINQKGHKGTTDRSNEYMLTKEPF